MNVDLSLTQLFCRLQQRGLERFRRSRKKPSIHLLEI